MAEQNQCIMVLVSLSDKEEGAFLTACSPVWHTLRLQKSWGIGGEEGKEALTKNHTDLLQISTLKRENGVIWSGIIFCFNHVSAVNSPVC